MIFIGDIPKEEGIALHADAAIMQCIGVNVVNYLIIPSNPGAQAQNCPSSSRFG
jgi:hypothetical protein